MLKLTAPNGTRFEERRGALCFRLKDPRGTWHLLPPVADLRALIAEIDREEKLAQQETAPPTSPTGRHLTECRSGQ